MNPFVNSKWIWNESVTQDNTYADFFETLRVEEKVKYKLYISVCGDYAVYVNDNLITFGQYRGFEHYKVYDTVDLDLEEGENNIVITAWNIGQSSSTFRRGIRGIIYTVTADGKDVVNSSENTLTAVNSNYRQNSGIVTGQLGYTFFYDNTVSENEKTKAVLSEKTKELFPRPIKKLEVLDRVKAKLIAQGIFVSDGFKQGDEIGAFAQNVLLGHRLGMFSSENGSEYFDGKNAISFKTEEECCGIYFLLDLGREETGVFDIDIELDEDADIIASYGEHIDDGRPRSMGYVSNFAFGFKGHKGHNQYVNPFLRLGGRYIQLHVFSKDFKVNYAGIRPTEYPLSKKPFFKCDDALHNKIYEVGVRTLKLCMHEHYEDCPWREQALYTMDSRNQMLCGYYAFGEYEFAKASLILISKGIREDNLLELCNPGEVPITIPSFSAVYLLQLYEYLLFSGDKEGVKELLPTALRIGEMFAQRIDGKGLVKPFEEVKYWNFYEWQSGLEGIINGVDGNTSSYAAPLNAFVSMAFSSLAKIFEDLGDERAEKYNKLHEDLNGAIKKNFFDKDDKYFYTYLKNGENYHLSQLTQALCLYCGVLDDDMENLEKVIDNMVSNSSLYPATPSHLIFVYDAMMKKPEKYGRKVFEDVAKKWGDMLFSGATTFWETFSGADDFGKRGSLCHGWSAIAVYLYFAYGVGIYPEKTGFNFDEKKNFVTGLSGCRGKIKLKSGTELTFN